ncbi:MAG: ATP phosphoribosyltransferase regulatory subunit [Candidatus Porifericomitaceae bacterium WSBS_2022_MAG_OTU9]
MNGNLQGVRGMRPIAPVEAAGWQLLEQSCRRLLAAYGYAEIRLPIVEKADLFCKSIGDTTDIVSREMYVFVDRNGEELALRPEGTASCVRAALELSLLQHRQRLWYSNNV